MQWKSHIIIVQLTNLRQLREAVTSIWTRFAEECFQHLVESMPGELNKQMQFVVSVYKQPEGKLGAGEK